MTMFSYEKPYFLSSIRHEVFSPLVLKNNQMEDSFCPNCSCNFLSQKAILAITNKKLFPCGNLFCKELQLHYCSLTLVMFCNVYDRPKVANNIYRYLQLFVSCGISTYEGTGCLCENPM